MMALNKQTIMKKLLFTLAAALPMSAAAITPMWLRDVQISPDGNDIAFTYKGDIWRVPVAGGDAVRLTTTSSYESNPIWSPDGSKIAYASDHNGNFDIYIIDANGSAPKRLTYNSATEIPESFTPDGKYVMYSAAIQDPAESALFPSVRLTELYKVPVKGGAATQMLATPARYVSWAADGKSFLYQDVKGMEDEWRKHHTSSVTRDVWRYDLSTGKHTNLTARGGEDLNPVSAGQDIYFLSERGKSPINVYKATSGDMTNPVAVTQFKTHPVRFLSRASNGRLCFTYDGEIYTLNPAEKSASPKKVKIELIDDYTNDIDKLSARTGARGGAVSPDGKSVAFIYRGNVFVTSVEYNTTKQITSTPEAESNVTWSNDGKSLIFTSQCDGLYNIYQAKMQREDEEANFANATLIDIQPLFKTDKHERTFARMSPDGKQLAFILDRNKLMVMDMDSKKVRQLTDGSTFISRVGGFDYTWSPDSRWIALEIVDRKHDPYYDIAIINVETAQLTNLTNSGYFDQQPRWSHDGNALIFASERYGMRNHASWGSQNDVMAVFMNQDAYDRYKLSEEDYAIRQDMDKKADKDKDKKADKDKKSDKDKKDSKDDKKDSDKVEPINVELDGIEDRVVRLTPMSSDLVDAIATEDFSDLYYLSNTEDGMQLWKVGLRKPSFKLVTDVQGTGNFDVSSDGKTMFILGSNMRKFEPKGDKLTPINYTASMKLDHAAEREFMFDNIAREERERFYTTDMHGVDWPAMTAAYRKFLPYINNNYDFAEMVSEWLGELNVSHTGGRYRAKSSNDDDFTGSLGLFYDYTYTGKGMRVSEIIEKGPFDRADTKLAVGSIITKINGEEITPEADLSLLLCDLYRKKVLVTFTDANGKNETEEVVIPITATDMTDLLYNRWVKNRAADVDRWSNGRLGYVHIRSMGDESFRKVYSDLLGKYNDREGVVVDIRWNGGGRLHEDIEVLLSGEKYFTQEIRGTATCDMPSRRWNKPSIMLMCEACYSNAHGTPWVYKHRGIGSLVGMPVPGTMTSVNWVTMQDPTLVYGIPVVGYRLADGSVLENQQLEPDVKVANDPAVIVTGYDQQLKASVDELLRQIDSKK
jgi:Tol biopolymer transport system component/C-terminal processing protease CtpA/Prc